MVKRRDKTGRRQILQLEDKKPPPVNKVPKKGLIHYSDSEDERTHPKPEPSVGSSSEKNSTVDTAPIDSQLADFMKEIDALQAEEKQESSEAEPNPCVASSSNSDPVIKSSSSEENGVLPTAQSESKEQVSESHTTEDSVASTHVDMGMYCLWQECRDDSTGYSYYWNMQTNEVTWECPPEYLAYLQYLNSTMEPTTSQQAVLPKASSFKGSRSTKKTKSKKDTASGLEGKIIPISYFGGSSSSEDSTDDSAECSSDAVVSSRSKLKKKSESSVSSQSGKSKLSNRDQGKKTSKETTVCKAETIGPQLPPDFQFSEDVPVAPTTSVINSSLDGVPYVENEDEESPMIGPQLPAYYIPRENKVVESSPPPADQECSTQEESQLTKVSTSDEVTVNGTAEQDPPQSTVDGSVALTSSDGETWEESLLKIEEQFRNLDKVRREEEEEPDSTTKKETGQPVQTVNSSRTNEKVVALRPVVEYSSCTDDDDEMDTSSGGPSRQNSYRPTNSNLIDSMFSFAHTSDKKFGFGFSKCQQLEMENNAFEAGFSQNRGKQPKKKLKGSYSKINFVKSKEVLDLNSLNKCTVSEQEEVSSGEVNNNLVEDESQPDVNLQNASPQNGNPAPSVDDVDCDEIDQALESALTEKVTESMSSSEKTVEPSTSEIMVEPSTSDPHLRKSKKHPADTDINPDTVVKKLKQEEPETSAETGPSLTTSILHLSNILVDKLSFLVSSQSTMSSLTSLLIQMQTRLIDWQSGALNSKYFMDRLQEVDQYLHHYEMSSVTGDWMCQWDSEHKRYFYVNRRTQQSQWTFPPECSIQVAMQNKQLWENHISDIAAATSTSSYPTAGGQFPLVSSSMSDERSRSAAPSGGIYVVKEEDPEHEMLDLYPTPSASWTCPAPRPQPSPPPPPPGVDSPPPPPPPVTPPPASPPPPPPAPDSTELEEGEIPDVDMDVEDSNSSGSVIYSGKASQSDDLLSVPSNMLESCSSTGSPDHHPRISTGLVSSTSAINSEQLAIIIKPPQPVVSSSSGLVHVSGTGSAPSTWTHTGPSCSSTQNSYHPIPMVADEASVVAGGASVPSVDSVAVNEVSETFMFDNGNNMPTPSASSIQHQASVASTSASTSSTSASGSSTGTSRKEKKKGKLLPGLALKRKNIPNLVEKWVKIKKQQEKENKNADEARISTSM